LYSSSGRGLVDGIIIVVSLDPAFANKASKVHLNHPAIIPVEKCIGRRLFSTINDLQIKDFFKSVRLGEKIQNHLISMVNDVGIGLQSSIHVIGDQPVAV